MLPHTIAAAQNILKRRHFDIAVDLGCGEGLAGFTLKKHCNYLIGVDHNLHRLYTATKRRYYDKLIHAKLQNYNIPPQVEAAFLFDVIEHLPESDAYTLLHKLNTVPFVLITTPETFHKFTLFRNHHQSHWTQEKLQQLNYKTTTYPIPLGFEKIIALKLKP